MPQKNGTLTTQFTLKKETKNTFCYQEDGDEPIIGVLYVQKSTFPNNTPEKLTVTVQQVA